MAHADSTLARLAGHCSVEYAAQRREQLQRDLLTLLRRYREDTGLTPVHVDLETCESTRIEHTAGRRELTGVRVTVQL